MLRLYGRSKFSFAIFASSMIKEVAWQTDLRLGLRGRRKAESPCHLQIEYDQDGHSRPSALWSERPSQSRGRCALNQLSPNSCVDPESEFC